MLIFSFNHYHDHFQLCMVWSYLPILQYDATLFGSEDKREKIALLISFDLRLILSFRTMGVFYPLEIDVINRTIRSIFELLEFCLE